MYGPGGEVIHAAGGGREAIIVELDLAYLRRVRRDGWHALGQTLKSFRDGPREFPPYGAGSRSRFLDELGPLRPAGAAPSAAPTIVRVKS